MEVGMEFPQKTKNISIPNSAITLRGIYQKESKSAYNKNSCMFIVSLFTIAESQNQSRYL
jgi:hypothetical protein